MNNIEENIFSYTFFHNQALVFLQEGNAGAGCCFTTIIKLKSCGAYSSTKVW